MLKLNRPDHDPRFLPFLGNHHKSLPPIDTQWGGGVSFRSHLGKPLTESLWIDITERFCCTRLLVYPCGEAMWLLGWEPGTCIIILDDEENVRDIDINPIRPPFKRTGLEALKEINEGPPHAYHQYGGALLDSRRVLKGEL